MSETVAAPSPAKINGRDIIRSMVSIRFRQSFCIANFTPAKWWECDVFEITKAGYMREYEVKISRGDFFADAGKQNERWPQGWTPGATPVVERKHELLAAGDPRGPSMFFYVTPPGLLQLHEVPLWAGLIEVRDRGAGHHSYRYSETEAKPAPRLHRQKVSDNVRTNALGSCYYRMHDLLGRLSA